MAAAAAPAPAPAPQRHPSYFVPGVNSLINYKHLPPAPTYARGVIYPPTSNYVNSADEMDDNHSRLHIRIPTTKNAAVNYRAMHDVFESTMEEFKPHSDGIVGDDAEFLEASIFNNMARVYEDGTKTLILPEEGSLGHTFVTIAIKKINDTILAKDRMYMFRVFEQVAQDISHKISNGVRLSSPRKTRRHRKTRRRRT